MSLFLSYVKSRLKCIYMHICDMKVEWVTFGGRKGTSERGQDREKKVVSDSGGGGRSKYEKDTIIHMYENVKRNLLFCRLRN